MSNLRALHLRGATGAVRMDTYDGRPYLVVPVVALMEGVIHAVNAETPEFVPLSTLEKAARTWDKKPATLYHPKKNGRQCSANSPDILAESGIGLVFNPRVQGKKLLCEAWIDSRRAKELHPEMYERLLSGESEEVSVGAFVVTDDKPGEFNGKKYTASWKEVVGDHLAFLPGGRGACSIEMGCGSHRAASMRVLENRMELDCPVHDLLRTLAPMADKSQVGSGVRKKKDCSMCKGSGSLKGNPCEACGGYGRIKAASISTSSGCSCHSSTISGSGRTAAAKPQLKAAGCGCKQGDRKMEKSTRAELIAELVTDRYSGFRDGDEGMLEACGDARLEEFRGASDARKAAERNTSKLETELTNTNARLKVAEERLKTAEQAPSEEDWLAKAPPFFKTLLEHHKAEEDATRSSLISQLKDLGANTEEELKQKSTADLKTLAAYARVEIPDFSGRGIPQERHASINKQDDFTPPNPYAEPLKALQSKTVN